MTNSSPVVRRVMWISTCAATLSPPSMISTCAATLSPLSMISTG
ncbi:hypothetical protein [Mesorhizobium sp. AA22]|nr:hypothetical protein [Mesorhizobium sp. AA22]